VAWRDYSPHSCAGARLVIVQPEGAVPDDHIDMTGLAAMADDAHRAGALFYAADVPALSDLAMPAVARHGPLQIAISTDGVAPALARRLREQLARMLAAADAELTALIEALRQLRDRIPPGQRGDQLYRQAARLHLRGRIDIGPPEESAAP
jgi:precorrin-2 dehydrogenase / sirohydrochlorin ferrochelatase